MYQIKSYIIYLISLLCLLCSNNYVFAKNNTKANLAKEHSDNYYFEQFQDVFHRIEKGYMQKPNKQEMTDLAIDGMLKSLDPYSGYYTDEELEFFISHTDGEFGGIGVEIIYESGNVKIITPLDDLPAYQAGIKAGDYIIGVNGKLVSNMGFNKAVKEMRGAPGTKLNLLVVKSEENTTKEIEITREIIKITPIKFEIETENTDGIGYIRIVAFNNNTISELKNAMSKIIKQLKENDNTLQGIILDVRNNPGGLLDQAVAVCEYFLDHGNIVSIRTRDDKKPTVSSAGRFVSKAPNVPIVVLINAGTASAAEIVAGALQDHKRAVILGTTSFGKGLVQTFTRLNKRAGMKLTTAKYYTPNGRSINAKGIEPDIFIENAKVEYAKKEKKESSFSNSSIKSYLKKYNTEDELKDSATSTKKFDHKLNMSQNKEKKLDSFHKNNESKEKRPILSDKYKNDYQYARAYDLIRGLIISSVNK